MKIDNDTYALIEKSRREKTTTYISCNNIPILFQAEISKISEDSIYLKNPISYNIISKFRNSKEFSIKISLLNLIVDNITTTGNELKLFIKKIINIKNLRQYERFFFSIEDNATCEILNPYDNMTVLTKKVIEMSQGGLSIQNETDSKLFSPGQIFKNIKLSINDKLDKTRNIEIIYSQTLQLLSGKTIKQTGCKFI